MKVLEWAARFLVWLFRRPSLKIRVFHDDPDQREGGLQFEAENASGSPTSLHPEIRVRFLDLLRRRYPSGTATFDVRELDRNLPPFEPKLFSASARHLPRGYGGTWFRVYRFQPRRGIPRRVRIRNARLEALNPLRFWFELWRLRLLGRIKGYRRVTLAEHQALKRSRGPH